MFIDIDKVNIHDLFEEAIRINWANSYRNKCALLPSWIFCKRSSPFSRGKPSANVVR